MKRRPPDPRLLSFLSAYGPTISDLALALRETQESEVVYSRLLALYCYTAIDDMGQLIAALRDEEQSHFPDRETAIFCLRRWLAQPMRSRRAIHQAGFTFCPQPLNPLPYGFGADPEGRGHGLRGLTLCQDAAYQVGSTARRKRRILMDVHSVL